MNFVNVHIVFVNCDLQSMDGFLQVEEYDGALSNWQNGDDRLILSVSEEDPVDHISLGADLGPRAIVSVSYPEPESEVSNG